MSNLPVVANTFEVSGVEASEVDLSDDGSLSNVELGETDAEIAAFSLESDDEDVEIFSITLEDEENNIRDAAMNFVLYADNVAVDSITSTSTKYLTFNFDPVVINEGQEVDFSVRADIVSEAGDSIHLVIDMDDADVYVRGTDSRY